LEHHKTIATRLKGVTVERTVGDLLSQELEETYINPMNFDVICGTGGLLSHAPKRVQSLLILTDAFQPEGITRIFQDSVFMMPHLGVLSTVDKKAAWQIFEKDCLVSLGTVIAPRGRLREGAEVMDMKLTMSDGTVREEGFRFGEITKISLGIHEEAHAEIHPKRGMDLGMGPGKTVNATVHGGVVGLVIDSRGRPLMLPEDSLQRKAKLIEWFEALSMYE
jgi:hypothetical protein